MFGIGGAVLGMILYAAFGILTGLVIGYVALGVGYIVAKAITMGSKGVGGQPYQIAAAVLPTELNRETSLSLLIPHQCHRPLRRKPQSSSPAQLPDGL
jgi:hypothetical protein